MLNVPRCFGGCPAFSDNFSDRLGSLERYVEFLGSSFIVNRQFSYSVALFGRARRPKRYISYLERLASGQCRFAASLWDHEYRLAHRSL